MMERLEKLGRRWPWLGWVLRVQRRFSELHGSYLAAAVTLSGFLSVFPLLVIGVAVLGFVSLASTDDVAQRIVTAFGFTGEAATLITDVVATAEDSRAIASVIGVVGLLWTGLGLGAALQYAFNEAWQVTGRGLKDRAVVLGWMLGAGVLFAASFTVSGFLPTLSFGFVVGGVLLGLLLGVGLYAWTSKILPNRSVGWRPVLAGAAVAAIGLEILKVVGSFYIPRTVASSSALYGSIGVVFAILAWVFLLSRVLMYAIVVEVVTHENRHGTETLEVTAPELPERDVDRADRSGDRVEDNAHT